MQGISRNLRMSAMLLFYTKKDRNDENEMIVHVLFTIFALFYSDNG